MICPNCQKENVNNVRFCSSCGFEIGTINPEPMGNPSVDSYTKTPEQLEKAKNVANMLTTISICLRLFDILLLVISLVIYIMFNDIRYIIDSTIMTIIFIISSMSCLTSLVLVTIAFIKIVKNKIKSSYVKTAFIMHLVLFVITVTVFLAIWTFSATTYCMKSLGCSEWSNCG